MRCCPHGTDLRLVVFIRWVMQNPEQRPCFADGLSEGCNPLFLQLGLRTVIQALVEPCAKLHAKIPHLFKGSARFIRNFAWVPTIWKIQVVIVLDVPHSRTLGGLCQVGWKVSIKAGRISQIFLNRFVPSCLEGI